MTEPIIKKSLISQGWLRVLLFCILYAIAFLLIAIPLGFLVILLKKDNPGNGEAPDMGKLMNGEFLWLTAFAGLAMVLALVFLFRKFIDRKSFSSLGLELTEYSSDAITGIFLAITILGTGALILFFSGHLQWTDINFNGSDLFVSFGIFAMIAFSEELAFRGYILSNLMESFNKWVALIISAVLFMLFHWGMAGIGFLPLVNIFLAGILMGINYVYTKNLWFAILFHLGWIFFQGPLLGYKVGSLTFQSLLQMNLKGDALITGGDFGFQGSIICTALIIAAIFSVYWVYEWKSKLRAEAA